jgi:hypothetical protein
MSLTFAGDPGLEGLPTDATVTCSFPDVEGLRISIFAQAPDATFSYRIWVSADKVFVHVDSGADSTFHERNFEGGGVSGFDATEGALVDTDLADAPPSAGVDPGSIGTVTAVKGSIDCGNQTPGSSTITVTGDTSAGRYEASRLDPVVVECYPLSDQVTVIGIARAGDTKLLLMVSLGSDGLHLEEALGTAGPRYYGSLPGSATLTPEGGHADGDVVERDADTTPPHTLHVEGTVTCGTPIRA